MVHTEQVIAIKLYARRIEPKDHHMNLLHNHIYTSAHMTWSILFYIHIYLCVCVCMCYANNILQTGEMN
jgi:hypothetical protein